MTSARTLTCKAAAILVSALVTTFWLLLLDRRSPVVLYPQFSSIEPNPARAGDTISITWTALASRSCGGVVIPRIIDSAGIIHEYARIPVVYKDLMRSNPGKFTKTLQLPAVIIPGPAKYEAVVIRWCNLVQEWFWPLIDTPFPINFEVFPLPSGVSHPYSDVIHKPSPQSDRGAYRRMVNPKHRFPLPVFCSSAADKERHGWPKK